MGTSLVDPKENNFLAAVARSAVASAAAVGSSRAASRQSESRIGLAYVDLSTGQFRATEFGGEKAGGVRDEIEILRPREILLARPTTLFPDERRSNPTLFESQGKTVETRLDDWVR